VPVARRLRNIQTFRSLHYRDYRFMWFGQVGHSACQWMDQVARAVLVIQLTDSAIALSIVIATRLVPTLLFGLLAGAVADRFDKKPILSLTQYVSLLSYLYLGVAIVGGFIDFWQIVATAFVSGTAMAFNQPVRQALIPSLVPREHLLNAIALNSTALSLMRVGGGSIAGVLLLFLSTGGVYLVTTAVYAVVVVCTWLMHVPARSAPARPQQGIMGDLVEGLRYVSARPDLGLVVALALILFVFGFPYQQVFTPLLATRVLEMGESGVGFLAGATGLGAVIGTLFVASRSVRRPGVQLMLNMTIFGAALVAIALVPTLLLTALLLGVAGAMTVTYNAFTNTILLENTDPAMHGRVMALLSLDRGLIPLGAIVSGFLAEGIGVRPGLFVMGTTIVGLSILALAIWGRRLAAIRTSGHARPGHGHGASPAASPAPAESAPPSPASHGQRA